MINTYLKGLKVNKELLKEAEKEGSAREFFFKLVELLSGGKLTRREIKKIPYEEQERLIFELVRENSLEDFFSPKEAKNIYSALRKAFRKKERERIELEWEGKIANWRKEFETLIQRATTSYLVRVKNRKLLKELFHLDWLVPSDIIANFNKKPSEFTGWVLSLATYDFLEERAKRWLKLPPFKRREKIIKDTLKAYKLNCLELGIYALFSLTEGIVWDTFVRENTLEADIESLIRKRNRKFVTIQYAVKLILENIFGEGEIPKFLDWVRFVDYKEGELNRHAIQHGVAVEFGTKENYLRLFFFLDFLHEIVEEITLR
ncbi:hypothetical protein CLV27_1459 [Phorcysia thermohydrogeniphila]|uniref:Uncharacterized protein n=1 Tax=Phorcysia thermohydrogeniphila TaxID=936138 RepID=A0A4R1GAB4_9BACT|nr:hypothetical protein CLV27_1459 [Phorcysia thermohydrogeniphila]